MPGSHRAPRRRVPAWTAAALGLAVLVVAGLLLVPRLLGGDDTPQDATGRGASAGGSSSSPSPSPSPSPATSAPPSPTASTTPKAQAGPTTPPDLPELPPDQPRRLVIDDVIDVGFDLAVSTQDGLLVASSDDEVSRWADRGSPGSPAEEAVVIVGTAGGEGTAFDRLAEAKRDTDVRIETDQGELVYTVARQLEVPHEEVADHPVVTKGGSRLVLVGEQYDDDGERLDTDLVVVAVLTDAVPA